MEFLSQYLALGLLAQSGVLGQELLWWHYTVVVCILDIDIAIHTITIIDTKLPIQPNALINSPNRKQLPL